MKKQITKSQLRDVVAECVRQIVKDNGLLQESEQPAIQEDKKCSIKDSELKQFITEAIMETLMEELDGKQN